MIIGNRLFQALIINIVIAVIADKNKQLDRTAISIAVILGSIVYIIDVKAYVMLVIYYSIVQIIERTVNKKEKRDHFQVLANFALPFLVIICNRFITQYLQLFCILLSVSLCDSVASAVGISYASNVYDIVTKKKITPGISGGISIQGTLASIFAGLIYGMSYYFIIIPFGGRMTEAMIVCLLGFWGMLIDSYLGALFQIREYCSMDGSVCGVNFDCKFKESGKNRFLSNNGVNFLSEVLILFIFYLAFR